MDLTSFIMGICVAFTVVLVVYMFIMYSEVGKLKTKINLFEHTLANEIQNINQNSDVSVTEIYNSIEKYEREFAIQIDNMYKHIDSRVDKLDSKITKIK